MPTPSRNSLLSFQAAVEQRLAKPVQETRYGYPIEPPHMKKAYDAYLKTNPHVAGMVVGGGFNDSDPNEPISIISNPYNEYMGDANRREGLYKIEAARALMLDNPVKDYPISENLQRLRKQHFKEGRDPYATDDQAFKESLISRIMTGDIPDKLITPEMKTEALRYEKLLKERANQK
jgi:hypothetical protein